MPTVIEATYRVTTPMFCGGADPTTAELRLPSFKGVLRFWWRALAWSRLNGDLEAVCREEDALFGSAHGGQSRVLMRFGRTDMPEPIRRGQVLKADNGRVVGEGVRYLGYGVMEAFGQKGGQLLRACYQPPFEFTVQIRSRDDNELKFLRDALEVLGVLGGMGAKSRKGYGSLSLTSLRVDGAHQWNTPSDMDQLCNRIEELRYRDEPKHLPEYTALTQRARHVLIRAKDGTEPIELLNRVGCEMLRYRSWGHNQKVLGSGSERNFKDDHDLMKSPSHSRRFHPRRVAFGLPHNYGKKREDQVGPSGKFDRRASPLFIHIHRCGKIPVAVLSFLPALFLPKDSNNEPSNISVGGQAVRQAPEDELYKPIREFLDRILDPSLRKEPFTRAMEVAT